MSPASTPDASDGPLDIGCVPTTIAKVVALTVCEGHGQWWRGRERGAMSASRGERSDRLSSDRQRGIGIGIGEGSGNWTGCNCSC